MITFRTGTHNPLTLYVASEPYGPHQGRDLPGWMKDGEWSIGWLPHEGLAALAVEAWNAFVCVACPWGCPSCSLNRATCECYEHQDRIDEDGRPVEGSTPIASPAQQCGMHYSWPSVGIVASGSLGPCVLVGAHERHRDEHGNEWRSGLPAAMVALPPAAALLTLREQLAAWRSADQDGYDPGALAEAAEVLLDGLDAAPAGEVVSVPPPVGDVGGTITIADMLADDLRNLLAEQRTVVDRIVERTEQRILAFAQEQFAAGATEERLRAAVAADDERIDPIAYRREVLGEFPPDMRSRRQGGRGPLATGGIITDPPLLLVNEGSGCTLAVPPPAADRSPSLSAPVAGAYGAPADEPAPVPPPVDALLKLIDKFGDARYDVGLLVGGPSEAADDAEEVAVRLAAAINAAVNALHRQATEERTEEAT